MAVEYLHCCNRYIDMDYNDVVIYYNNQAYCYEHLLEHIAEERNITLDEAEKIIDEL